MDTRIIKILIAAASLVYTVYLFTKGNIGSGIGMVFVTAILVLIIFRSLRIIIAFFQLRRQKMDKARIWLNRVNPEKLWKKRQGYYHFLDGTISMQESNLSYAEKAFKKALSLGLKMNHDKAAAKLYMGMIAASNNRQGQAKKLILEAKKLDTKGLLKKDIKEVEQAMRRPQKVQRQKYPRRF